MIVRNRSDAAFWAGWLFVIFVSAVDGYLVLRHRNEILSFELNPLGRVLIRWNDGDVWYLLAAKFAGTVLACAAMLLIYRYNARYGVAVAAGIAACQLCLLMFLFWF